MSNFDIYADSAANLSDEMVAKTGIKVISFNYTENGEEKPCYTEGKFSAMAKSFYEAMEQGADFKTSLICEENFVKALTPSLEAGKDVLLITITEGLSGTYAQAKKAQATLSEQFPDRKIYVADSANASLGEGLLALKAHEMREEGKDIDECYSWIENNKYKLNSCVTVNDLKYLRKSGRVSTIVAVAGAILNIKPMLKADGASPAMLTVYSKERGRRKSIDAMVRAFTENVTEPDKQTVAITHGNCEAEANELAEKIRALGAREVVTEFYDLCTGTHVGPGTLALFFMGKDRRTNPPPEKKFGFIKK